MGYVVSLQVNPQSYAEFLALQQQFNAATKHKLAHELGSFLPMLPYKLFNRYLLIC